MCYFLLLVPVLDYIALSDPDALNLASIFGCVKNPPDLFNEILVKYNDNGMVKEERGMEDVPGREVVNIQKLIIRKSNILRDSLAIVLTKRFGGGVRSICSSQAGQLDAVTGILSCPIPSFT